MILYIISVLLVLWVIKRQWKLRRILRLSRKLKNQYVALPIIGHGLMFLGTGEDRMRTFQKIGYKAIKSPFGLTSVWLGSQYYAFTCDPIIAEIVSKTSLHKTELMEVSRHLMGNGLIFAPTYIWRPRRKVMAPTFSHKNLNAFIEIFAEQSLITAKCLKPRVGQGTFSIWKNISAYAMDSVCQTALGVKMNSQNQPLHPFLTAFEKYCKLIAKIVVRPWLHVDPLYKHVLVYTEAEKHKSIIHDFVDNIIRKNQNSDENNHISTDLNTESPKHAHISSFLDLLKKSSGGNIGYTDQELREEMLVLLLAGTDTSAVGASFTCVLLSRNTDVQKKAYEELCDVFGDSKRPITVEDLSRLTYIDAVIKETLRLYPPVPIIVRKNEVDIKLPSGITLPVDSCTGINIWGIHRNPKYWGADAEKFNPDRFLNGSIIHRSAFMPFSCGPRNCLGYKYAMMSMKVLVATLFREYRVLPSSDISSEDLLKPLRVTFDIMMKDVDNFKLRLEHRSH